MLYEIKVSDEVRNALERFNKFFYLNFEWQEGKVFSRKKLVDEVFFRDGRLFCGKQPLRPGKFLRWVFWSFDDDFFTASHVKWFKTFLLLESGELPPDVEIERWNVAEAYKMFKGVNHLSSCMTYGGSPIAELDVVADVECLVVEQQGLLLARALHWKEAWLLEDTRSRKQVDVLDITYGCKEGKEYLWAYALTNGWFVASTKTACFYHRDFEADKELDIIIPCKPLDDYPYLDTFCYYVETDDVNDYLSADINDRILEYLAEAGVRRMTIYSLETTDGEPVITDTYQVCPDCLKVFDDNLDTCPQCYKEVW